MTKAPSNTDPRAKHHESGQISPSPIRTISIGGATFDLFVSTDRSVHAGEGNREGFFLPMGEKIWMTKVQGECGGGAANTSVGLSRLGCTAAFCGIVSDDQWGTRILTNLHNEKVDTAAATILEHEPSSFSIILSAPSGERVILAHQGTSRHLHDVTFDAETAHTMDWLYLNHIHADSCVIEDDLIGILTSPDHPRISWNPGGCQIDAGLRAKNNKLLVANTDILLLNKEEAAAFTQKEGIEYSLRLLKEAGAEIVCITDGKHGAWATDGTAIYHCPAVPCPVIDTTGAGDAFGTAVTWAIASGKDLPTALKAGTINAMSVVGAIGAQPGLLTDTEIQLRIERTTLDIAVEQL